MNKEEIDKILSRLERIDHKEYNCSFEFADSGSFEETCMCFDERKKLANYIKELQQENKQLKDNWNKLRDYLFNIRQRGFELQNLAGNKNTEPSIGILMIIEKMQELEIGDSNE